MDIDIDLLKIRLSSTQGFYVPCVLFVPRDSISLINILFRTKTSGPAPAEFPTGTECPLRERKVEEKGAVRTDDEARKSTEDGFFF